MLTQLLTTGDAVSRLFADTYPHGYVLIGTRRTKKTKGIFVEQAIQVEDLVTKLSDFVPHLYTDYYLTASLYKGGFKIANLIHHRQERNVLSLVHIVIDIDGHGKNNGVIPHLQDILQSYHSDVDWMIYNGKMPQYHAIHFTGRGLQFWYTFEPLAPACRVLFDAAAQRLIELHDEVCKNDDYGMYEGLTVDKTASRRMIGLFRLPCMRNTATGQISQIWITDDYKVPHIKTLLEEMDAIVPVSPKKKKAKPAKAAPRLAVKQEAKKYVPLCRYRDSFLEWRCTKGHIVTGQRNNNCFLYYNNKVQICSKELAEKALWGFNSTLADPLPEREIRAIIKSIKGNGPYCFIKQARFYELIGASEEERRAFEMERKPPSVLKREAERAARRQKKAERDDKIRELALSGKTYLEIRKEMGVGEDTIARVLTPNKAINAPETRKEQQRKRIAAMIEAGKPRVEIAKALGISASTLARRLAEMQRTNQADGGKL